MSASSIVTGAGQWSRYMNSELNFATEIEGESDYVTDGDVIMIFTSNHSYQFEVTDSHKKHGLICGGALGDEQFTAACSSSIQEGYGASFDVEFHGRLCRLLTSDVMSVVSVRKGTRSKIPIVKFSPHEQHIRS
jgi:hypothetical protein